MKMITSLDEFYLRTRHVIHYYHAPAHTTKIVLTYTEYMEEWDELGWIILDHVFGGKELVPNVVTQKYAEIYITEAGIEMLKFRKL